MPNGLAIPRIAQSLGVEFIAADGGLNRALVRQRAFSDSMFRQTLESIIHPIVQNEMASVEAKCLANNTPVLIYDIPLLVESGKWRSHLHQILVVDCHEETQIRRVQTRNQMPVDDVVAIIRAQASRTHRLACADLVLCNDGISLSQLEKQCQQISTIMSCRN